MQLFDLECIDEAGLELLIVDADSTSKIVDEWADLIEQKVCIGEDLDLDD